MSKASHRVKGSFLSRVLWSQKLNNPLGYLLLALAGALMAYVTTIYGVKYGLMILGVLMVWPFLMGIVGDFKFGVTVILFIGFFTEEITKFVSAPVGILNDGILLLLGISLMLRLIKERNFTPFQHPVTVFITIWMFYNVVAVLNPVAATRLGWLYAVRPMAGITFIYFVVLYAIKEFSDVKYFVKVMLGLTIFAGFYGLKQEWLGFSSAEMAWLHSDPLRFMLIYQWGRLRVFSVFSDPTTMGIIFVYMSFFIIGLMTGPFDRWKKIAGGVAIGVMMLATAYGGSRTPIALIPVGVIFFLILHINKRTLIGVFIFFVLGTGFMLKSTSNGVIYRIQSSFSTDDASVQIRLEHQEFVQPFLRQNPFGWGLASIGEWGKRFNKDSWMADFAHDSGFIRIAAELGYVGLFLYFLFLGVSMYYTLKYYFLVKDPKIKAFYLGINLVFFILIVANFPQEAIVILPTSLFFNIFLAIAVRLKDFDEHYVKYHKNR
ncbi:MAG TPA: O-antigen ligase domain-containing protein [Saprospiraceae bacterium]|nr:O-antigen ligase domain-containing protein [Saprospiraceae bacterium]